MGYFYGWSMQRGNYCNGVTLDPRKTWRNIMYVKSGKRFWTVGENYKRWIGMDTILNDESIGNLTTRRNLAKEEYGTMNGPPIICKYMKKYPQVLRIHAVIPIMHSKIHFCGHAMTFCLHKLSEDRTPGFKTMCRRFDDCRDNLENGKLQTSAKGFFRLSQR